MIGVPEQPSAFGVTIMFAATVVLLEFKAVNAEISPDPLAARPILGVSFTQSKVVPETPKLLENATAVVNWSLHID